MNSFSGYCSGFRLGILYRPSYFQTREKVLLELLTHGHGTSSL